MKCQDEHLTPVIEFVHSIDTSLTLRFQIKRFVEGVSSVD